jgi:hypothetical protein
MNLNLVLEYNCKLATLRVVYQKSRFNCSTERDALVLFKKFDENHEIKFISASSPENALALCDGKLCGTLYLRGAATMEDKRFMRCTEEILLYLPPLVAEFNGRKNVVKITDSGLIL